MSTYNIETNKLEFVNDPDLVHLRFIADENGHAIALRHQEIKNHEQTVARLKEEIDVIGRETVIILNTIKKLEKERNISTSAAAEGIGGFDA